MRSDNWHIHVHAETTDAAGKHRSWTWKVPQGIRRQLAANKASLPELIAKNIPPLFYGCDVSVTTPLHYNQGHVDPDTRVFAYDMGPNG